MQIGNYEVNLVDAGRFRLDGGAMFGVVPKVLWEKRKPADEQNRIQMSTNLLLIKGEGRVILVDTGLGNKFNEKFASIYAVDHSEYHLHSGLKKYDLTPADITDVILTHLHFDHAGGSTFGNDQDEILPTFPGATYYIQKKQYEWAIHPSEKDRASFIADDFVPLQKAGQLELLEEGGELFPNIELIPVDGHTFNQQVVIIHGQENTLLYAADLIPTSAHVAIPYVMAYDLNPLTTIEEKKKYLKMAVENNWLVFFEHDPEIPCGTIQVTEKGYTLGQPINL